MKSYNEMSQDAKNKRRSAPSGRVRKGRNKKTKKIKIQYRYTGDLDNSVWGMFQANYYNKKWQDAYKKYATVKDAKQGIKNLNSKDDQFEYRLKNENTKTTA